MARWRIKPLATFILLSVLVVILLVLVLPQVDLLDTAFQRNTAPVVIHAQATSAPSFAATSAPVQLVFSEHSSDPRPEPGRLFAQATPNFLPILLHSIRI